MRNVCSAGGAEETVSDGVLSLCGESTQRRISGGISGIRPVGRGDHDAPFPRFRRKRNAGENAEAPPVADTARRFQGSGAIFGAVSAGNHNAATWANSVPYNGKDLPGTGEDFSFRKRRRSAGVRAVRQATATNFWKKRSAVTGWTFCFSSSSSNPDRRAADRESAFPQRRGWWRWGRCRYRRGAWCA